MVAVLAGWGVHLVVINVMYDGCWGNISETDRGRLRGNLSDVKLSLADFKRMLFRGA